MAQTLNVTDGTITVNLLSGNLKVLPDGWKTETGKDKVWEHISCVSEATDANVRTEIVNLNYLANLAAQYRDNPLYDTPVWFTFQSEGESAKRALVSGIEIEVLGQDPLSHPLLGNTTTLVNVVIHRARDFENSAASTGSQNSVSTLGGEWAISISSGDSPARIQRFDVIPSTGVTQIHQIWIGIRPTYKGVGSFNPLWEAETADTPVVDATASGGNKVQYTFSTSPPPNDGLRLTMEIGDVIGSNYDDFVGRYLVLGRMKVNSAATQVWIEMRQYWQGSYSAAGINYIDGEVSWLLYPMGLISLPPTGNRDSIASGLTEFKNCGFSIFANSLDGTGSLDIDCFVLIPADHIFSADGIQIDDSPSQPIHIYTDPDDKQWVATNSTYSQGGAQPSFEEWEMPRDGAHLVIAGQNGGGHVLSETFDLDYWIYPRWRTYRNA